MPWSETTPMNQKIQFMSDYLRQNLSMSELCQLYSISRKTAYKWVDRYLRMGPAGLEDRSRRPHHAHNATPSYIVEALLESRRKHLSWGAKPVFTRLFEEFGLPKRIRTDNGVPFATTTLARLSSLSAWWVRLGILPDLIEPGRPDQNGRHERMHKKLKAETTRPPAGSNAAQQRKFNPWRDEFNSVRPHEALDQETPASCYQPSPRPMPDKIPQLEYPDRFEVRYVSGNGGIRWNHKWVNVSTVCIGDYVGFEEIDNGIWNVYYGMLKLGRFDERTMRIEDAFGRLKRRNV